MSAWHYASVADGGLFSVRVRVCVSVCVCGCGFSLAAAASLTAEPGIGPSGSAFFCFAVVAAAAGTDGRRRNSVQLGKLAPTKHPLAAQRNAAGEPGVETHCVNELLHSPPPPSGSRAFAFLFWLLVCRYLSLAVCGCVCVRPSQDFRGN